VAISVTIPPFAWRGRNDENLRLEPGTYQLQSRNVGHCTAVFYNAIREKDGQRIQWYGHVICTDKSRASIRP
jgi:hypothetical protein